MRDEYIESIYHGMSLINSETEYLFIENVDCNNEMFLGTGVAGEGNTPHPLAPSNELERLILSLRPLKNDKNTGRYAAQHRVEAQNESPGDKTMSQP
jgi:hypothetical protein